MRSLRSFLALAQPVLKVLTPPALILVTAIACSYKTPPAKTPAPSNDLLNKSVFVNADGTAKTFVCGWAPLSEIGFISEWILVHKAHTIPACNLQFKIEENAVIGYQVNPSAPKESWAKVVTIPILSHSTRRCVEDKYGRCTKEVVDDTTRDFFDARSQIRVNWQGLRFHDFGYQMLWGGTEIVAVTDRETKAKEGDPEFIGLTLAVTSPIFGRYHQAQIRLNFLEFKPESVKTFPPRLYKDENSNHFGAIWGMGKEIEGHPLQFVARWDMRPEALPHKLCLNGFDAPNGSSRDKELAARAKKIAIDVVEEWNNVFAESGITPPGRKAFVTVERQHKFDFDLRCPSITYVSDRRISANSPLGIAMAQADVMNGKMLWGGMVVYGGALDHYVEAYRGRIGMTQAPQGAVFSKKLNQFVYGNNPVFDKRKPQLGEQPFSRFKLTGNTAVASELKRAAQRSSFNLQQKVAGNLHQSGYDLSAFEELAKSGKLAELNKKFQALRQKRGSGLNRPGQTRLEEAQAEETTVIAVLELEMANLLSIAKGESVEIQHMGKVISDTMDSTEAILADYGRRVHGMLDGNNWQRLMVGDELVGSHALANEAVFGENWRSMGPQEKERILVGGSLSAFRRQHQANVFDTDNTIEDFVGSMRGVPENLPRELSERSNEEIVEVSLKKTFSHEFGHMVGLAHNFKENIMPKRGTVPEKYWLALEEERERPFYQNAHTIMGYPHPYQMQVKTLADIKVGKQDELTLRYIYKNEYAAYREGDEDFTYLPVPSDGLVPNKAEDLGDMLGDRYRGYRVSYFPSCTDYMEWFAMDPYCNRWDRGYNAKTIVEAYLNDYESHNIRRLENLAGTGISAGYAEYYLWSKSLDTFSRVRKFYDYMRFKYRNDIQKIASENRGKNLYSFEKCNGGEQTNKAVLEAFAGADPEFAELCEANKTVVTRLSQFLTDPGEDFTVFDNNNISVPVGEISNEDYQDYGRMHGTWVSLSALPLKFSALHTLTTAIPYRAYGSWIIPVRKYARAGRHTKYTYASLYPMSFTEGIANAVKNNLSFVADGEQAAQVKRTALFMGSFLYDTFRDPFYSTNDYQLFDSSYMNSLRDQTNFIFNESSFVPIIITAVKDESPQADPERVKRFTGEIYVWGDRMTPLGDVYMLPEGKVFLPPSEKTFIYPLSDIYFLSDNIALVWAIRVMFDPSHRSDVGPLGTKQQLYNKYRNVTEACLTTAKLKSYFSPENRQHFKGFKIIPGIAGDKTRFDVFTDSVENEFKKYNAWLAKNSNDRLQNVCAKALDDMGLAMTQALSMVGVWMPQISQLLYK